MILLPVYKAYDMIFKTRVKLDGGRECCCRPGRQNKYFKVQEIIFCCQQILNYSVKCREIQSVTVIPFKLVLLVMGGHCCFSPRHQKNLATPLLPGYDTI